MQNILSNKFYDEPSVFIPENLLREARRQKNLKDCEVPEICLLDPDGDLVSYLINNKRAVKSECWACYHSVLYTFKLGHQTIGIIPCIVGASYAVLVAEQLFVSGCNLLISVTSAGVIKETKTTRRFALIREAVRDEGTSYHYLPKDQPSALNKDLEKHLNVLEPEDECPYFSADSWTTDAPYRETSSAIENMKLKNIACVEMEAAALYALAECKGYKIICFAHLTNSMAQTEGDFEKGEEFGSVDTLDLVAYVLGQMVRTKE